MPGYDTSLRTAAEFVALYRDEVLVEQDVWGGFDHQRLVGFLALKRGWIDHLYVEPDRFGQGIGGGLVRLAQREQEELRLHTFQSNILARALYKSHGFVIEEETDGTRNEERMPDLTYRWRRTAPA